MDGFGELAKLIVNYGMGVVCLAVLIILHVYNVKVSIPEAAEKSAKQIDGLVAAFREELMVNRTVFREELENERKQCHEDHQTMMNMLGVHQQQAVNYHAELLRVASENQKLHVQVLAHLEGLRRPPRG